MGGELIHSTMAHRFGNSGYSSNGLSTTEVLVDCNLAVGWSQGEGSPASAVGGLLDSGYSGSEASPANDACSYSHVYIVATK